MRNNCAFTVSTIAAALALTVAAPGVATTPSQRPARPAPTGAAPVALTGRVAGVPDLRPSDIEVHVNPTSATAARVQPGVALASWRVPAGSIVTRQGSYEVHLAATSVPRANISPEGLVNFEVIARDPHGSRYGVTMSSARLVRDAAGAPRWTQPLAATSTTAGRAGLSTWPTLPTLPRAAVAPRPVVADVSALHSGAVPSSKFARRSCSPGDVGAGDVYGTTRTVWATIGTSYPINGDQSWMTHQIGSRTDFSSSFGIGTQIGDGRFYETGSRSVDKGAGFVWAKRPYMRSYRVSVTYRKVAQYFDRCPGNGLGPYDVYWTPITLSGGHIQHRQGLSRPHWKNCRRESAGIFSRYLSNGKSYEQGEGVKIFGLISVNLSSTRAYNAEAKLNYVLSRAAYMCGNNADPAHAGKVMESRTRLR